MPRNNSCFACDSISLATKLVSPSVSRNQTCSAVRSNCSGVTAMPPAAITWVSLPIASACCPRVICRQLACCLPAHRVAVGEGLAERDGGQSQQKPRHGPAYSAREDRLNSQIGAAVDPG